MVSAERPVLVVSGLAAEARIAAGEGVVAVAAPPAALTEKLAAVGEPIAAVVSFGLAGGLDPSLPPGTLVVPDIVLFGSERFISTGGLSDRILGRLTKHQFSTTTDPIVCLDAPVLTVSAKAELRAMSHAAAVDTESHLAAAYAARRNLPFAAIRAVCDPATRDLPPLAMRAIGPDGRLVWRAIGEELRERPAQLAALPGTAFATLQAMRALRRARRLLGLRFGL